MRHTLWATTCLIGGLFLGGCAHQVPATPNIDAIAAPSSKLPLSVGIYFSDTFLGYRHSESKWGDTWNFDNLGQASASQFREACDKNFTNVVRLDGKPSRMEAEVKKVDLMIAPEIAGYSFDIPLMKFQNYPATITYRIEVYEGDRLSFSSMVQGVGDTKGSPGFDFSTNPAKSASRAIEEGVNQAMSEIRASERVKQMIKAKSGTGLPQLREY